MTHPLKPNQRLLRVPFFLGCLALAWAANASAQQPPLWFVDGLPSAAAQTAIEILNDASAEGLDPRDYDPQGLQRAIEPLTEDSSLPPDVVDRIDRALTSAMTHYLSDLHNGRVEPLDVHANYPAIDTASFDAETYLRDAVAADRLTEAVHEAAPSFPLYRTLRDALAQYRALAALPLWNAPLPPLPGNRLNPGEAYSGLPKLAQRLEALGDLPSGAPVPPRYERELVDAVKSFQARHALDADGVIGPATLAQFDVSPAARARQIALTMERLRWTPLAEGSRAIVVNVPEFVLRAYEHDSDRFDLELEMKVIVGKALDTRTPLFTEDMRYIEFSPYWNVPSSIAHREIIPRLQRDPEYFTRQGFEFVSGNQVITTLNQENLDAVINGKMRIRQRSGPMNSLGDIKFVFPNDLAIYLHDTSSRQLFSRGRRDLSHGCIRVEAPVELAKFVLQGAPEWTEARIRAAMKAGKPKTVALPQPVPVVLAYGTAIAHADGRVYFVPDIYGQDKLLDAALQRRARSLPAVLSS